MKKITIAVDGFSSCGKSTMAKFLARKAGYIYIDTGAMYRAITLYCIQNGFMKDGVLNEEKLAEQIDNIKIEFKPDPETGFPETYLNDKNVEREIRLMEVSNLVSVVSAIEFVRKAMVKQQQEMGKSKGVVMDGRDIGTVVFPDAELKIFATASPETRARRRYDELKQKGESVSFEEISENVRKRDHIDQTRTESPLKKADDAIVLDNGNMSIDEQNEWLTEQFEKAVAE
jgi:cytidylate kinase